MDPHLKPGDAFILKSTVEGSFWLIVSIDKSQDEVFALSPTRRLTKLWLSWVESTCEIVCNMRGV